MQAASRRALRVADVSSHLYASEDESEPHAPFRTCALVMTSAHHHAVDLSDKAACRHRCALECASLCLLTCGARHRAKRTTVPIYSFYPGGLEQVQGYEFWSTFLLYSFRCRDPRLSVFTRFFTLFSILKLNFTLFA